MTPIAFALLAVAAGTSAQAQESRSHDAHEHGVSTLELAIEQKTLMLVLQSPGMDIVGFEHPASSESDTAAVAEALRVLADPTHVVALPEAAACRVTEATVELDGAEASGEQHTAFHVRYVFDCAAPDMLTALGFPFFTHFAHAQEIEARYVTDAGAGTAEIERDTPELTLN